MNPNDGGPAVDGAAPDWSEDGVPLCSYDCPSHDGKRCELMGLRPGGICEPMVVEMSRMLRAKENGT